MPPSRKASMTITLRTETGPVRTASKRRFAVVDEWVGGDGVARVMVDFRTDNLGTAEAKLAKGIRGVRRTIFDLSTGEALRTAGRMEGTV